jgi:hypothetical protein
MRMEFRIRTVACTMQLIMQICPPVTTLHLWHHVLL